MGLHDRIARQGQPLPEVAPALAAVPAPARAETAGDPYAELKGNNPSKRTLYVITARGKAGTCRTEITFDNKTEDTAKKIGDSLRVK